MKKLLSLLSILCLTQLGLKAADVSPDKQWTVPVQYALDEEVTWYFDFSSTDVSVLPNGADLFIWIWVPLNPDESLTDPKMKLSYEGDRIWALRLTPTEFFGMSAADILANSESNFYFLLRSANFDDYHTGTLSFPKVDYVGNFTATGSMWSYVTDDAQNRLYPESKLSIWFNANLADGFDGVSDVHIHSGYNNFSDHVVEYHAWETEDAGFDCATVQTACYTRFKNLGGGIFRKDLVPYEYFQADLTDLMENIEFLFVQKDWSGTTPNLVIYAAEVLPPPSPVLSVFPMNFGKNDLINITRTSNPKGTYPLKYEITGDNGRSITGDFLAAELTQSEKDNRITNKQSLFVDIKKSFGDNVKSLHIVVKDVNGNVISDSEKQLTIAD
jgi:hypothetical protein